VLTELAKKDIDIDNLNKQITALQNQVRELQLTATKESETVQHDGDAEFHSSVEHQPQDSGHSSSLVQLEEKLKMVEIELQSSKDIAEEERKSHEAEVMSLKANVQHLQNELSQRDSLVNNKDIKCRLSYSVSIWYTGFVLEGGGECCSKILPKTSRQYWFSIA